MKATIQGMDVEGTPDEIAEFHKIMRKPEKRVQPEKPSKKVVPFTGAGHYKPWSKQEDELVREAYEARASQKLRKKVMHRLCVTLGRTPAALSSRAHQKGWTR